MSCRGGPSLVLCFRTFQRNSGSGGDGEGWWVRAVTPCRTFTTLRQSRLRTSEVVDSSRGEEAQADIDKVKEALNDMPPSLPGRGGPTLAIDLFL